MAVWQIPWGMPDHSWTSETAAGSPGGCRWVLTGIDAESGLGSADLVADANAQGIMKTRS